MIEEYLESELTTDVSRAIAELSFESFESEKTVEQRLEAMLVLAKSGTNECQTSRRFAIWDDGRLLAHARTFVRTIKTVNGELPVLALASVCTRTDCRGQGLGAKVVNKAFEQIDNSNWPDVSLFQTPVPIFYEKLGCRIVNNQFVNRLNEQAPDANPWRDDTIMIYPRQFGWPSGVVDMNGPDY